jgi:gamma-glutamylcyclotransferase (GGCT)/AIG2-like uncharacterized protein YtfP
MSEYLFVYGTLLSHFQHPMHQLLAAGADCLGPARITGKLYDLGEYPGLVIRPDTESRVLGEVYRLRDPRPVLARLDQYEACPSDQTRTAEYRRRHVIARLTRGGHLRCWAYVYRGPRRDRHLIRSGDYLGYLDRRA